MLYEAPVAGLAEAQGQGQLEGILTGVIRRARLGPDLELGLALPPVGPLGPHPLGLLRQGLQEVHSRPPRRLQVHHLLVPGVHLVGQGGFHGEEHVPIPTRHHFTHPPPQGGSFPKPHDPLPLTEHDSLPRVLPYQGRQGRAFLPLHLKPRGPPPLLRGEEGQPRLQGGPVQLVPHRQPHQLLRDFQHLRLELHHPHQGHPVQVPQPRGTVLAPHVHHQGLLPEGPRRLHPDPPRTCPAHLVPRWVVHHQVQVRGVPGVTVPRLVLGPHCQVPLFPGPHLRDPWGHHHPRQPVLPHEGGPARRRPRGGRLPGEPLPALRRGQVHLPARAAAPGGLHREAEVGLTGEVPRRAPHLQGVGLGLHPLPHAQAEGLSHRGAPLNPDGLGTQGDPLWSAHQGEGHVPLEAVLRGQDQGHLAGLSLLHLEALGGDLQGEVRRRAKQTAGGEGKSQGQAEYRWDEPGSGHKAAPP